MGIVDIKKLRQSLLDQYGNLGGVESPLYPSGNAIEEPELKSEDLPIIPKGNEPRDDWKKQWEMMNEIYKPETEATGRFNELLGDFPERNKPSIWRKIVAAGQGAGNMEMRRPGGIEESEKVLQAPYLRDVGEWKERAGPYYNAANLERQSNINERQLAQNFLTNQAAMSKIEETERHNRAREESEKIRALAYRAKNEGFDIKAYGDRIIGTRTVNGQVETIDLGPSGDMDERDLQILKNQGNVAAATARGVAERENIAARGQNLYQFPDGSMWRLNNDDTWEQVKPSGTGPATRPGTQGAPNLQADRIKRNDILREIHDNPKYRRWVIAPISSTGDYKLAEPPTLGRWATRNAIEDQEIAEYNEVLEALGQPKIPTRGATQPPPTQRAVPPKQQGAVNPSIPTANPNMYGQQGPAQGPTASQVLGNWRDYVPRGIPGISMTADMREREQALAKGDVPFGPEPPPPPIPPAHQQVAQPQLTGIEPGHVAIRINATGEIVQVPQDNVQRALATGKYSLVQ